MQRLLTVNVAQERMCFVDHEVIGDGNVGRAEISSMGSPLGTSSSMGHAGIPWDSNSEEGGGGGRLVPDRLPWSKSAKGTDERTRVEELQV